MAEAGVTIRVGTRRLSFPLEWCRTWEVTRPLLIDYLSREQYGDRIRSGEFDLVGPGGLIIHPKIWPAGLEEGSVVDITFWHPENVPNLPRDAVHTPSAGSEDGDDAQGDLQPQIEEVPDRHREVDVRQREVDVRQREVDVRQREVDVRQREVDVRHREVDARHRELDNRQEELDQQRQTLRAREDVVSGRETRVQEQENLVRGREEAVTRREAVLKDREQQPTNTAIPTGPAQLTTTSDDCRAWIRDHRACLRFFAGRTRLGRRCVFFCKQ